MTRFRGQRAAEKETREARLTSEEFYQPAKRGSLVALEKRHLHRLFALCDVPVCTVRLYKTYDASGSYEPCTGSTAPCTMHSR